MNAISSDFKMFRKSFTKIILGNFYSKLAVRKIIQVAKTTLLYNSTQSIRRVAPHRHLGGPSPLSVDLFILKFRKFIDKSLKHN